MKIVLVLVLVLAIVIVIGLFGVSRFSITIPSTAYVFALQASPHKSLRTSTETFSMKMRRTSFYPSCSSWWLDLP